MLSEEDLKLKKEEDAKKKEEEEEATRKNGEYGKKFVKDVILNAESQLSRSEALSEIVSALNDVYFFDDDDYKNVEELFYFVLSNEIVPVDVCNTIHDQSGKHFTEHYDIVSPEQTILYESMDNLRSKLPKVMACSPKPARGGSKDREHILSRIFKNHPYYVRDAEGGKDKKMKYIKSLTPEEYERMVFNFSWLDATWFDNSDYKHYLQPTERRLCKDLSGRKNRLKEKMERSLRENVPRKNTAAKMNKWCPQSLHYFIVPKKDAKKMANYMKMGSNTLKTIVNRDEFWSDFDYEFGENVKSVKTTIGGRCFDGSRLTNFVVNLKGDKMSTREKIDYIRSASHRGMISVVKSVKAIPVEIRERYNVFSSFFRPHETNSNVSDRYDSAELVRQSYRLERLCTFLKCEKTLYLLVKKKIEKNGSFFEEDEDALTSLAILAFTLISDVDALHFLEMEISAFFAVPERIDALRKIVYKTMRRIERGADSKDARFVERVLTMLKIPDYKALFSYEKDNKKTIEEYGVTFYAMGERLSRGTACHYPDAVCTRVANWSQRKWYHFCPLNNAYTLWVVRKDVMCLLHATDTMRNVGEELMFENLTKHWTYASNKHTMLDKMRKWCSSFGMLNWISSDKNMYRQSGDMLSPDHPDFDDMFDILNDVMASVSDNRGLFEELIKYSYANPYKPSLLRGISSFLRLKKHHIIDRSVVRCIRAYLAGDDATVMCWLKEKALRYLPSHLILPLIVDLNLQMRRSPAERSKNVSKNMEMVLDTLDQVRTISDRLAQYVEVKPGVEYKAFVETYSEQHPQRIEKRGLKRKIECSIYENRKGQEVMEPSDDETVVLNDLFKKNIDSNRNSFDAFVRGDEGARTSVPTVVGSGGKIVKKIKKTISNANEEKENTDIYRKSNTLILKRFLELPEMSDDFMKSSAKISTECYIKTPESAYSALYDVKRFLGSEENTLHQMLRSLAKLERNGVQTSLQYPGELDSEFGSETENYNIYEKSGFLRAILAKAGVDCECDVSIGKGTGSDVIYYSQPCQDGRCSCLKSNNRSYKPFTKSLVLDLTFLFGKIWDIYIDGDARSREESSSNVPKKKRQTETYMRAKRMREELNRHKIASFFDKCKHILTDHGCIMDMLQIVKEDEHRRNFPSPFYFDEPFRSSYTLGKCAIKIFIFVDICI